MIGMLTVTEAAQRVGRSPQTVRRWIRDGRLPAVTQHGRHAIEPADLDGVRDELYPMLELGPARSVAWETARLATRVPSTRRTSCAMRDKRYAWRFARRSSKLRPTEWGTESRRAGEHGIWTMA
jgi:excisionase family DNA binding protein